MVAQQVSTTEQRIARIMTAGFSRREAEALVEAEDARYPVPAPMPASSLTHCPSELTFLRLDRDQRIAYFAADSKSEPGKVNVVGLDTVSGESHCSCRAGEVGRDCWHAALVQAAWDGHRARPALRLVERPAAVSVFRTIPNANRERLSEGLYA